MSNQNKIFKGFTLIEAIITIGILGVVIVSIFVMFDNSIKSVGATRARTVASSIANEHLEMIRNMPYEQINTLSGEPKGILPDQSAPELIIYNNINYTLTDNIQYFDDPFDGCGSGYIVCQCQNGNICHNKETICPNGCNQIEGMPTDNAPDDYKKVEVKVTWDKLYSNLPVILTTDISPKGLELEDEFGALAIKVLDSNSNPVPQVKVNITNDKTEPKIDIENNTDNNGNLQVLNLTSSQDSYHIVVTKDGYSTDSTYDPTVYENPINPDKSVIAGKVTNASFFIDKTSNIMITTFDEQCKAQGNVYLKLIGKKLISESPVEIPKYSQQLVMDENGVLSLTGIEWDSYDLIIDPSETIEYDIAGIIPPPLINILPDTNREITLALSPHTGNSLLVIVKDSGTQEPLDEASVTLTGDGALEGKYNVTKMTGIGSFQQDYWQGGSGQELYTDKTKYFSDDGNLDTTGTPGQISLKKNINSLSFTESFGDTFHEDLEFTTANWDTTTPGGQVTLALEGIVEGETPDYIDEGIAQTLKLNSVDGTITFATLEATQVLNGQTIQYFLSADGGVHFEDVILASGYTCGNVDGDDEEVINQDDIEFLTDYLYEGGPAPDPLWVADVDGVSGVDVGDITYLIDYVNKGGPAPDCDIPPNSYFIIFDHPGSDLRFQALLSTKDTKITPILKDININYTLENYKNSGELISSTYTTGEISEYKTISWLPITQEEKTGAESVKIQIALASSKEGLEKEWIFTGPEGKTDTYYTVPGSEISPIDDKDYDSIRYKIILQTEDIAYTPIFGNISINYTVRCIPPGQTYFNNLEAGLYNIEVNKDGYMLYNDNINISGNMRREILLTEI